MSDVRCYDERRWKGRQQQQLVACTLLDRTRCTQSLNWACEELKEQSEGRREEDGGGRLGDQDGI